MTTHRTGPNRRELLMVLGGGAASALLLPTDAWAQGKDAEDVAKVTLQVNDGLSYSIRRIEVKAGQTVELTITHTGKMPKVAMGHNFVLLKQGTKMKAFANKAMAAQKTDYIPPSMASAIIAHTKLVGGGESDTITFAAPPPGEYDYLCSFPGHYSAMNGKLVVEG